MSFTGAERGPRFNLFAGGMAYQAIFYTFTSPIQKLLLLTIGSKLDFRDPQALTNETRFITLEDLVTLTGLAKSTVAANLAVLSGEVCKPVPSVDELLWLTPTNERIKELSAKQEIAFGQWQENRGRIYVTRTRRFDPVTKLQRETEYSLTEQVLDDYEDALLTGRVALRQDPNRKYILSQGSARRTVAGVREADSSSPRGGLPGSARRTAEGPVAQTQQSPQGAISTVYNSVDNSVDIKNPGKERTRSGGSVSGGEGISKTALLGAIAGVLKPTEGSAASTYIRDTLLGKGYARDTIERACRLMFMMSGNKRISHDPGKMQYWFEACEAAKNGHPLDDRQDNQIATTGNPFDRRAEDLFKTIKPHPMTGLMGITMIGMCEFLIEISEEKYAQEFYDFLIAVESAGNIVSSETITDCWNTFQSKSDLNSISAENVQH